MGGVVVYCTHFSGILVLAAGLQRGFSRLKHNGLLRIGGVWGKAVAVGAARKVCTLGVLWVLVYALNSDVSAC